MPNPWDVGSAGFSRRCGFEALATTSAGFAWALGKHDQHRHARRARRSCRGARGGDGAATQRRQRAAATRTIPAASPRRWRCSPKPAPRASRSRTTTRPPAASTSRASPPSGWPWPPKLPRASPSRWCSPPAPRTTFAASTTSTTRSPGSSPTATPAPTRVRARPHRPASRSRAVVDGGRRRRQRPHPAGRPDVAELAGSACAASRRGACSRRGPTALSSRRRTCCATRGLRRPSSGLVSRAALGSAFD